MGEDGPQSRREGEALTQTHAGGQLDARVEFGQEATVGFGERLRRGHLSILPARGHCAGV